MGEMTMDRIFNSVFEVSLRMVLLLSLSEGNPLSLDRVAAYDFITINSRYFGYSDAVLHGENEFGLSEYASRRHLAQQALRELVLDGAVRVAYGTMEFFYSITESGIKMAQGFKSEYAMKYLQLARKTISKLVSVDEAEIIALVNSVPSLSLKG